MSLPPLVDFWTTEKSTYEGSPIGALNGLLPRAERALAKARSDRDTARTAKDAATNDVAAAQQQIALLRAKLLVDNPAEAAADALELRKRIGELRTAMGRVAMESDQMAKLDADIARASAELDRCGVRLREANAGLEAATAREAVLARWLDPNDETKLAPAFLALPDEAKDTLDVTNPKGAGRKAAYDRISEYFETDLKAAVAPRWLLVDKAGTTIEKIADDAEDALDKELSDPRSGLAGQVEAAQRKYDAAWSELAAFVRNAAEEIGRAKSLLGIAASLPPASASLRASLTTGKIHDDAVAAKPAEKTRNDAIDLVLDDLAAFASAALVAGAADPVALPKTVTDAYTKLANDQAAALLAGFAFRGADKPTIDLWEAALPDDAFRAYAAVRDADDALTRIKDAVPATLFAKVRSTEQALANAIAAAKAAERVTAFLRDSVAQSDAWRARAGEARTDHLTSAARGDA